MDRYTLLLYCFLGLFLAPAQEASRLIATQTAPFGKPSNFMWVDTTAGLNRMRAALPDSAMVSMRPIMDARYVKLLDTIPSFIMTTSAATTAIADINTNVNGKVPQSRTLTINGTSQDLSANRTWTVGDISSASTYVNPTWLTSLAWSKVTGAPSFLTAEVDGSITNEIELPTQTGNSGKILTTNGTSPSWTASSVTSLRDKTGLLSSVGVVFTDTFSVASATPTIDLSTYLSAAGKASFKVLSAVGYRVGATTGNSPNVTITGLTSSAVSLILNQTNTATVSLLSVNVLSGLPTILTPDPANVKVLLSAIFY